MLLELRIRNYAVIDNLGIRLAPGLNILTGETGAGKSIIVGALSLLLGERASSELVRPGAERATVEGVFDVADDDVLLSLLDEQGLQPEDGLLILRREVAVQGRNRAWVNGSAATATLVGEIGARLVDLHGQHEHQALLRPDEQRAILDAYADAGDAARRVASLHAEVASLRRELEAFEARRRETEQRADFLRFQADEIEGAALKAGEDDQIEERLRRLEHAEDLVRDSGSLHDALYAGDESISSQLGALRRTLRRLLEIDPSQEDAQALLETAYYNIEELGRRMGDYAAAVEFDPGALERLRRRRDQIIRLKSKYGETLADVIALAERARAELDTLENADMDRRDLESRVEARTQALADAAGQLSELREAASRSIAADVEPLLHELGLPGARFIVQLTAREAIAVHGAEDVEFMVALNRGFEPRPLRRVASGGELARVMLALKTVLARHDRVPTLVFDEVDVGVGGQVAHRLGETLADVARHHQVFVITHLPQIASRADHHLRVEKEEHEGTALTRVHDLQEDERVRELVRMLGGDPADTESLEHARKLLATA